MLRIQNSKKYIRNLWNSMKEAERIKKLCKGKFSWRILWENFVFQEGNTFYKMPTFLAKNSIYKNIDSYEKVCDAMRMIKKYFWTITHIPKTEVLKQQNGHYIIKQDQISGEKLTKKILENSPKLLSKFKRLVIANEVMWRKEGVFLDLLGSDIITHPQTIHNLFTDGKEIYVFDFGLLEKKSSNMLFRYFSYFGQKVQILFIKLFF